MDTEGPPPRYRLFVGVDIAATTATVAWQAAGAPPIRPFAIEQSSQGFAALERRLRATGQAPAQILVVIKATGSYSLSLATCAGPVLHPPPDPSILVCRAPLRPPDGVQGQHSGPGEARDALS